MPTYKITDPNTGKTLKITGDSTPTEQELNEIFSSSEPTTGFFGKVPVSKYEQGERNIVGNIFERPAAASGAAIQANPLLLPVAPLAGLIGSTGLAGKEAQEATIRASVNPSTVKSFQDIALDKYYGGLSNLASNIPEGAGRNALMTGGALVGNIPSAVGLGLDILKDPTNALIGVGAEPTIKAGQTAIKKASPVVKGAVENVKTALTPNYNKQLDDVIKEGINKAVRPTVTGKKKVYQREQFDKRSREGVVDIIENQDNIQYRDADGNIKQNKVPENLEDFASAQQQRLRQSYQEYTNAAEQAGKSGKEVDINGIIKSIQNRMEEPEIKTRNPALYNRLNTELQYLLEKSTNGKISPVDAQDIIESWNAELKQGFRSGEFGIDTKASVLREASKQLRKNADDVISKSTGTQYQKARNIYAAHKALADDVGHRIIVAGRQSPKGFFDILDGISSGEMIYGATKLAVGQPSGALDIVRGLAVRGVKGAIKEANNPNNIIRDMFKKSSKIYDKAKSAGQIRNYVEPELLNPKPISVPSTTNLPYNVKGLPNLSAEGQGFKNPREGSIRMGSSGLENLPIELSISKSAAENALIKEAQQRMLNVTGDESSLKPLDRLAQEQIRRRISQKGSVQLPSLKQSEGIKKSSVKTKGITLTSEEQSVADAIIEGRKRGLTDAQIEEEFVKSFPIRLSSEKPFVRPEHYGTGKAGIGNKVEIDNLDTPNQQMRAFVFRNESGVPQGVLKFSVRNDGSLETRQDYGGSYEIFVNEKYRRKKVASSLINKAKELGFDVSKIEGVSFSKEGAELKKSDIRAIYRQVKEKMGKTLGVSGAIALGAGLVENAEASQPKDKDAINAILGEVGPGGKQAMNWVASAIRNRNNGLKGIYGAKNPNVVNKRYTQKQYNDAKKAWEQSKSQDFTGGARYWFSDADLKMPKVQKIIRDEKLQFIKKIGGNSFYRKMSEVK